MHATTARRAYYYQSITDEMQVALVFHIGVLALLGSSIAFPVSRIEELRDEEMNNLFSQHLEEIERSSYGKSLHKRKSTQASRQNLKPKEKRERIGRYLQSYGYIPNDVQKFTKKQLALGMWNFAVWNGAKLGKKLFVGKAIPTFERTLQKILERRRCGDPDVGESTFRGFGNEKTQKRYIAQSPWGKTTLTYRIESFDNDLSVAVQRQEIAKAFKLWSDASELTVSEVQGNATADINIQFAAGSHGDSTPFDGPGFVVAHAFYPEDGRIHFDSDEDYTTGSDASKVYLLSIAAHEIGHALGLGHSAQSDAIMHAQYQDYDPNGLALSQDDVNGIKYLYPSNSAGCVDEFWCEDILIQECSIFEQYCKNKCNACS